MPRTGEDTGTRAGASFRAARGLHRGYIRCRSRGCSHAKSRHRRNGERQHDNNSSRAGHPQRATVPMPLPHTIMHYHTQPCTVHYSSTSSAPCTTMHIHGGRTRAIPRDLCSGLRIRGPPPANTRPWPEASEGCRIASGQEAEPEAARDSGGCAWRCGSMYSVVESELAWTRTP